MTTEELKTTRDENPEKDSDKVTTYYTVGIRESGELYFDVGGEATVVSLLGLHSFAEKRIKSLIDQSQRTGDALFDELARAIAGEFQQTRDSIQQQLQQLFNAVNNTLTNTPQEDDETDVNKKEPKDSTTT